MSISKIIKTKVNVTNNGINMAHNIIIISIFTSKYRGNFVNGNTRPSFNIVKSSRTFSHQLIISISMFAITKFANLHSVKNTRLSIVRNIGEIITRNTIFSTTNQDNCENEKEKFFHSVCLVVVVLPRLIKSPYKIENLVGKVRTPAHFAAGAVDVEENSLHRFVGKAFLESSLDAVVGILIEVIRKPVATVRQRTIHVNDRNAVIATGDIVQFYLGS